MTIEEMIAEARALGVAHALIAASWTVDGNTKREFIPAVLEMFDAGDPAVSDCLPAEPNLSGEWADDLTPVRLWEKITGEVHAEAEEAAALAYETLIGGTLDALANAYEEGVQDTFYEACEAELRKAIA